MRFRWNSETTLKCQNYYWHKTNALLAACGPGSRTGSYDSPSNTYDVVQTKTDGFRVNRVHAGRHGSHNDHPITRGYGTYKRRDICGGIVKTIAYTSTRLRPRTSVLKLPPRSRAPRAAFEYTTNVRCNLHLFALRPPRRNQRTAIVERNGQVQWGRGDNETRDTIHAFELEKQYRGINTREKKIEKILMRLSFAHWFVDVTEKNYKSYSKIFNLKKKRDTLSPHNKQRLRDELRAKRSWNIESNQIFFCGKYAKKCIR